MKQITAFCLASFVTLSLWAQAEEVGRTKFELPGPEWALLTAFNTKTVFTGGATAGTSEPVRHKVFYLADADGTIRALLSIASQNARYGLITWTGENCPEAKSTYFTTDFGSNRHGRTLECMIVSTRFSPSRYFKPDSAVAKAAAEKQLKLFRSGYFLRSIYGSENGSHLIVYLATRTDFKGLADVRPGAEKTYDVPVELIAWSESLQKAVESSVRSFRGGLTLPPIEFKQ